MAETNKDAAKLLRNAPEQLQLCFRLAALEREWAGIIGEEYAKLCVLEGCELKKDEVLISLNAENSAAAASMNFRKAKLARMLLNYLDAPAVRIEIKVGRIKQPTLAKPPLPAWRRRVPLKVSEEEVERERPFVSETIEDKDLAESFARIKALAEKRKSRK